jgi:hypothetical protein
MFPNLARLMRDDDFWWIALSVAVLLLAFAAAVDRSAVLAFVKGFGRQVLDILARPFAYLAGIVRDMGSSDRGGAEEPARPSHWLDQLLRGARLLLLVLAALAVVTEGRAIWRTLTATESSAFMVPHTRSLLESARMRLAQDEDSLRRLQAERATGQGTAYGQDVDARIRSLESMASGTRREVQDLEKRLKDLETKAWNWKAAFRRTREFLVGYVALLWLCVFALEWTAMVNGISKDVRALRALKEPDRS